LTTPTTSREASSVRPSAPRNSSRTGWLGVAALAALAAGCGFNSKQGTQPDSGIEPLDGAPGDGAAGCYGPDGWRVCLDAAPSEPISLTGMLNTDKSDPKNPCAKQQPAGWTDALQPEACFVVGTTVTVVSLNVTGRRPLVIVGTTGISVMSLLDVGSHRLTHAVGPGAGPTECKMFARAPGSGSGQGGGGGAGGSFAIAGADGGTGNGVFEVGGLISGSDIGPPARLRGGCAGQPGGGGKPDDAGAGGGAVYLVSAGAISIPGKIDASGAGGGGGDATTGGAGGGAGGMIVLHGASIATTSSTILLADGGGGGGGGAFAGPVPKGSDGKDPAVAIPIAPAPGGAGGVQTGATGGDGGGGFSAAIAATIGMSGDTGAGGGGGGGGGGYIQTNHDLKMAVTSPVATIPP
jgi:hypothetical protein